MSSYCGMTEGVWRGVGIPWLAYYVLHLLHKECALSDGKGLGVYCSTGMKQMHFSRSNHMVAGKRFRNSSIFRMEALWLVVRFFVLCGLLWGCAGRYAVKGPEAPTVPDTKITERKVREEDLLRACERDPELDVPACKEILARLNIKDKDYVSEDIKKGNVIKVPVDFSAYKGWTPLPQYLPQLGGVKKFILVVKSIPFLGWYEGGRLRSDTQICIGKKPTWTKAGLYKVLEKDENHISQSYRNAYGGPAFMPYALKIYGSVWIHGGDVVGGYCSHGCINLPLDTSEKLFKWADKGTVVLVLDSLNHLETALETHSKSLPRSKS